METGGHPHILCT